MSCWDLFNFNGLEKERSQTVIRAQVNKSTSGQTDKLLTGSDVSDEVKSQIPPGSSQERGVTQVFSLKCKNIS